MIWKLLKKNISAWQIAGYTAASFVGLLIVAVAIQFYRDASSALTQDSENEDSQLVAKRNIVISKPVGLRATLSGEAPSFSASEIEDIEAQKWSGGVFPFQAADFNVWAAINFGGRSMSTALFFESVADELVDVDENQWNFNPSQPTVPILLPKDYLSLYNFGFAASGRMPMLSESTISSVPLTVTLSGNGRTESFPARIVGFSSWLNTVAVPQQFMDWAHERFGRGEIENPSRLIVKVDDAADPTVADYMKEHGYEVAGNGQDLGRAGYFLTLLTSVIAGIGALITLLALGILVLSLYLLIQKNRAVISGLLLIGYRPSAIAGKYIKLVAVVNFCVLILSLFGLLIVRNLWVPGLQLLGIEATSLPPTALIITVLILAITAVNALIIRRLIFR